MRTFNRPTLSAFAAKALLVLSIVLLIGGVAAAQLGGTGAISGTVTDATGGTVPDVAIVITNTETGIANNVASDSSGKYTLPGLAVGTYQVTARKEGFQEIVLKNVALSVGTTTIVNVALRVGQVSQQVQVEADAPVVETQDASLGLLVGAQEVKDLPLNGRSYISMALFSPGVIAIPSNTVAGFGEGTAMRLSVNGARQEGQVFLTDNTDTKGLWGNSTGATMTGTSLGIDAISEFQVLTNTYGAQYGGNGTVVNAAVKSGTNTFHGTVFDFERNDALDARNAYDPQSGPPPFYRHQFGAAAGGPIKKNKAFFFTNYEGLRENLGLTPAQTQVPDANARLGIIPTYQATATTNTPDCTTAANGSTTNVAAANPAAFAKIQAVLLTFPFQASGAEILNKCGGPSGEAFYQVNLQQPDSENYGVGKFDYNFSDKDSMLLTYIIDKAYLLQPNYIPTQGIINNQMTNQVTLEEKRIISPTMINTVHFSYFRPQVTSTPPDTPALDIQANHLGGSWGIDNSPWSGIGGAGIIFSYLNRWTGADQFFWTKGKHTIQMGGELTRHEDNINWPLSFQGSYSFLNMAAFFNATPYQFSGPPPQFTDAMRGFRYTGIAPYIQDKYQINPRLTLTLGVRYDFISNISEAQNKFTNVIGPLSTAAGFTAVPHAYYTNPTKKNIGPRFGFAWDPFGDRKTSVRGGFGMFYDGPIPSQLSLAYSTNPPYFSVNVPNPPLPGPFSGGGGGLPPRPALSQGLLYGTPGQYPNHNPYLMQYNLNIQRQIWGGTVASIGYVGTQARHLYIKDNENTCLPTSVLPDGYLVRNYTTTDAKNGVCPLQNNNFANMNIAIPRGTSNYNALQTSLTHGFSKGIEFSASYTYSRCISQGDNYTGGDSINVGSKGGSAGGLYPGYIVTGSSDADIAPCDFQITHIFASNVLYALPFHGNRLKDGWQTSLITTAHSGFLTTPLVGTDTANCGFNACASIERPDTVAGCDPYSRTKSDTLEWFNPACFATPAAGVFGNTGRNTIKGPGFINVDLSVTKDTKITESTKIELRAELFNFVNHTNLGFPTYTLTSASKGAILDTAGYKSRQIQFGAKFIF